MPAAPSKHENNHLDERTKPAFLRRVRIRGYKSIAFCDVPLQPLTILVGRNAAGKSNFIDALAFLRDTMETSVTEAVKRRGGWSSIACRVGNTQKVEFDIEAAISCGRSYQRINGSGAPNSLSSRIEEVPDLEGNTFVANYHLELSAQPNAPPTISREFLEIAGQNTLCNATFEVHGGNIKSLGWAEPIAVPEPPQLFSVYRPDRPLLSVIGTQPFIDLGDGLRVMGFYNFSPEAIRLLQAPNPGWLLEKNGRNLASAIESLKEIDPDAIQRVREYLSTIAEEVEGFDAVRYGEYETVRFRLRSGSAGSPLEFDAASMSDGTLRSLAALMAAFQIHLPTGPSVIGIEEPEAALHPAASRALVDALHEATAHTQILLTTHSADLLAEEDIDPGQVLVVRNRRGVTEIAPVDGASKEIIRRELDSLAGLHRQDQLAPDPDDLNRQHELAQSIEKATTR